MYKIEDNVPPPNVTMGAPEKYPFSMMDVGQSFFIADAVEGDLALKSMSYHNRKNNGKRFSSRKVEGGRRFWRIK